jgi:peptidyl-prolyl cis-trans isomerase SurA
MKLLKLITALAVLSIPNVAMAQITNLYGTAVAVNDRVITNYEILQRLTMLQAFGNRSISREAAINSLIEERLYLQAGQELSVLASEEEIQAGMAEFAARGELSTDEIIQYLGSRGVAPETFKAFIEAGVTWRSVVRARFINQARITDDDVDAALSFQSGAGQMEFLLSEIIISGGSQGVEDSTKLALRLSQTIRSQAAFSSAARKYSGSPSSRNGGRLSWLPSGALPANIVAQLLTLQPGEVTGPISLAGNVALFQLRSSRKSKSAETTPDILSYTMIALPNSADAKTTKAKARVLRSKLDTCLDMRAASKAYGENAFLEGGGTSQDIPSNIALALANLDPKETTTFQRSNGQTAVLMLCTRNQDVPEGERETIRDSLFGQKIASLGSGYLQELKGDAFIVRK